MSTTVPRPIAPPEVGGTPPPADPPPASAPDDEVGGGAAARLVVTGRSVLRWVLVLGGAALVYCVFLVAKGASPLEVLEAMWTSAFGSPRAVGETLVRAAPLLLAALAVAIPARAGLFNIGGEGQLVIGAVGAAGTAYALGDGLPTGPTLVLIGLGGAVAGMAWALIPALLRIWFETSEAIVSLLLNYVAYIVLAWLVFEPWRDPVSTGQAYSTELVGPQRLPLLWGNRVNIGILVALVAVPVVWWAFRSTRWGFRLRVVGGNPEAARRAGMNVKGLVVSAFATGGVLAGIGGMVAVAGVEGRLRPDLLVGFGYIAFLASWLGRHQPWKVAIAAVALSAIAVGGTGLKIAAGLSGGAVNVLMALILLAVLGWGRKETSR
ncbi:ABC transporter permease [Rhabdothermincola salaria]|uniref:ABC transporter permease n=1 Tax=Rhabdothermincola salaria TaxID=2903142 RepID=UPI001E4FE0D0|nr:ABC transporter permease [Rhabdothermincola salaria]MCD9623601.1 ABC transporter permease [Rhabdothermincola salaria]